MAEVVGVVHIHETGEDETLGRAIRKGLRGRAEGHREDQVKCEAAKGPASHVAVDQW